MGEQLQFSKRLYFAELEAISAHASRNQGSGADQHALVSHLALGDGGFEGVDGDLSFCC